VRYAGERSALKKLNIPPIGLPDDYYKYLLTGGTGQASHIPDARISYDGRNASNLKPGPFQITSKTFHTMLTRRALSIALPDVAAARLRRRSSRQRNGWGCKSDLFPWVEVTIGAGSNGAAPPSPFTDASTGEGSTSMGFYNVQQGDAPYLKALADTIR